MSRRRVVRIRLYGPDNTATGPFYRVLIKVWSLELPAVQIPCRIGFSSLTSRLNLAWTSRSSITVLYVLVLGARAGPLADFSLVILTRVQPFYKGGGRDNKN